jgi:hypothetical protein
MLLATGLEGTGAAVLGRAVERRKRAALREVRFLFADDEMAEADAFTGNVPQALMLLHGELTHRGALALRGSTLATLLARHEDDDERLRALWLAFYARPPSDDERTEQLAYLRDAGATPQAWEDLAFAMLISSEFVTNH